MLSKFVSNKYRFKLEHFTVNLTLWILSIELENNFMNILVNIIFIFFFFKHFVNIYLIKNIKFKLYFFLTFIL